MDQYFDPTVEIYSLQVTNSGQYSVRLRAIVELN
jgi:hypothetical protein